MISIWHEIKRPAWQMLWQGLLSMILASAAMAAAVPSFTANASGAANNLSVTANINIADADFGKNGNVYLGVYVNPTLFFNNGAGWVIFNGGVIPVYTSASLANRSIEVVRNADVSGLIGAKLYVGYGLNESDMLQNGKFGHVYTVLATPPDTTPPAVIGTVIANGALGVPINASIGATLSEAMDPATLSTATVKLLQGTTPVLGTVSYASLGVVFMPTRSLSDLRNRSEKSDRRDQISPVLPGDSCSITQKSGGIWAD